MQNLKTQQQWTVNNNNNNIQNLIQPLLSTLNVISVKWQWIETFIKPWHKSVYKTNLLRAHYSGIKLHSIEKYHSGNAKMEANVQEIIPELDLRGRSHYEKNSYRDKQMNMLTVALLIRCQLNTLIKLIGNCEQRMLPVVGVVTWWHHKDQLIIIIHYNYNDTTSDYKTRGRDLLLSHKDNVKLANPPQQIFQICPTH